MADVLAFGDMDQESFTVGFAFALRVLSGGLVDFDWMKISDTLKQVQSGALTIHPTAFEMTRAVEKGMGQQKADLLKSIEDSKRSREEKDRLKAEVENMAQLPARMAGQARVAKDLFDKQAASTIIAKFKL